MNFFVLFHFYSFIDCFVRKISKKSYLCSQKSLKQKYYVTLESYFIDYFSAPCRL